MIFRMKHDIRALDLRDTVASLDSGNIISTIMSGQKKPFYKSIFFAFVQQLSEAIEK